MEKKVKVREIKSELKEIKKEKSASQGFNVNEQEDAFVSSDMPSARPTLVLHSNSQAKDLDEDIEGITEVPTPRAERELERPEYAARARTYGSTGTTRASASSSSAETPYEDPMAAAARQVDRPSNVLREEILPAESQQGFVRSRETPMSGTHGFERERVYTPEQQRETKEKRRRYPWEA